MSEISDCDVVCAQGRYLETVSILERAYCCVANEHGPVHPDVQKVRVSVFMCVCVCVCERERERSCDLISLNQCDHYILIAI